MAALKTHTLGEVTSKYIDERGTAKRDAFEYELKLDLLGEAIKRARIITKSNSGTSGVARWCQKSTNF